MAAHDGFDPGAPGFDGPLLDDPAATDDAERDPARHAVFSFGTLRQASVQDALFGSTVPTVPDALVGWRLTTVRIEDPAVIEASGSDVHPGVERTGAIEDRVEGGLLVLDDDGLAAADAYEAVGYERTQVVLASGRTAWLYVPRVGVED